MLFILYCFYVYCLLILYDDIMNIFIIKLNVNESKYNSFQYIPFYHNIPNIIIILQDGKTAMMYAAEKGHIDIIKYLVEHYGNRININAKDKVS